MNRNRKKLIKEIVSDLDLIARQILLKQVSVKQTISPSQCAVLNIVARSEGLNIKDIAAYMGVTGSAVTQIVNSLVEAGLLIRETGSLDRRLQRISLTEQGRLKLDQFRKMHFQSMQDLLEPLSEEELLNLQNLHRKIISSRFPEKI